jgi:hypothetical protein
MTPDPAMAALLMDAEHRWCVQVEGEWALGHEVERHRSQAEFIAAAILADGSTYLPAGELERLRTERDEAQMEYADALIELERLRRIETADLNPERLEQALRNEGRYIGWTDEDWRKHAERVGLEYRRTGR